MGKYAVVGDSYAVVDPLHGHWAQYWADLHGHQIEFFGLEGSNLVNIAHVLERLDHSKYDGIIFHYTSPLRAEGSTYTMPGNNKIPVVVQMSDVYSKETKKYFSHVMTTNKITTPIETVPPEQLEFQYYYDEGMKFVVNFHNMMPHWFEYFDTIDENTSQFDATMSDVCGKFYSSVSIRWLARANFMAYRNAILTLNSKGIKNVTVFPTCGGFEQTINFVKSAYPETKIWDQFAIVPIHPSETASRNHIPKESAQLLAQRFSFE